MCWCAHKRPQVFAGVLKPPRVECRWDPCETRRATFVGPLREPCLLQRCKPFHCAGAVLWLVARLHCYAVSICVLGVVVLRRLPWQARASVCTSVTFIGLVVQSARLGEVEMCQNPPNSSSPCCKHVNVGVHVRWTMLSSWQGYVAWLQGFWSQFRGKRGTFELLA